MEFQHIKIANIQLHILENCSEIEREILNLYWEIDKLEPLNTAKVIREKFDLSQSELSKIYPLAILSFYLYCEHCNSFEYNEVKSHSKFKEALRKVNYNSYQCENCIENQKEKTRLEKEIKDKEFIDKQEKAIANKNWENLSRFDLNVLKNSLEMGFDKLKRHYGGILGQQHYFKFIKALENIEEQNLITLKRSSWKNWISDLQYLEKLLDSNDEIIIKQKEESNTSTTKSSTNNFSDGILKFKLTIDKEKSHPDSPLYSGTVIFKEQIVLQPNVEYVFSQWERANNNLFLTMIPLANIENIPEQKTISKLPIQIQKGINEFLKNLGKDINF